MQHFDPFAPVPNAFQNPPIEEDQYQQQQQHQQQLVPTNQQQQYVSPHNASNVPNQTFAAMSTQDAGPVFGSYNEVRSPTPALVVSPPQRAMSPGVSIVSRQHVTPRPPLSPTPAAQMPTPQYYAQPSAPAQDFDDFFGDFSTKSGASGRQPPQMQEQQQQQPSQSINIDRRHSSVSIASSLGSQSANSQTAGTRTSVLQDRTFAPPPKMPTGLEMIKSQLGPTDAALLPQFDMVKHSGHCLARFSLKALVTKKWKPTFWIAYGDNRIIFFRSKNDFEEWISNPFLKKTARDQLVKCKVDFVVDLEQPLVKGYSVSQICSKAYSRDGYMRHFKLEKWDNFGPTICAALGGKNDIEVNCIRTIMKEMIEYSPQMLRAMPSGSSDASSFHSSGVSDFGSLYSSPSAPGEQLQIEDDPKKKRSSFSFKRNSKESNDVDSAAATAQIPYTYDYDNAEASSPFLYENGDGDGDGRSRPTERSNSRFKGMLSRSKSKEPKQAIDDSHDTRSDLYKKSSSRLKGMLRSKSKEPKQPIDDTGVETKRSKSRLRMMTRSKSREPGGKTDVSNGKEPKSILKKMALKKKKKGNKDEDVQYYVGRPSAQKEFGYRPAEIDYGGI